jgi:nicotinamide mononucleotide adenylyltransferase
MYFYTEQQVKQTKKKYILSIGKRQPMHIGHKRTLERILSLDNFTLIYVIGSANLYGDELFDPHVNPLDIKQQIEQFENVFGKKNVIFLPIDDIADVSKWGPSLLTNLEQINIKPEECIIHFIGKEEDRLTKEVPIVINNNIFSLKPGQWLIELLSFYGFDIWLDQELEVDLSISARNLRNLDLQNICNEKKNIFAAYDYLLAIAQQARENNPEKEFLENIPITLNDLSLARLRKK